MFEEYAAKTIGIDFGTNNSVVGVYNTKIEKPLVIENEEGVNSTPSAVLLREPLEFSDVGRSAKEKMCIRDRSGTRWWIFLGLFFENVK